MKKTTALLLCLVIAATAHAQPKGVIRGTVTSEGAPVAGAPIQAMSGSAPMPFRTLSSATGEYSLSALPPGAYMVTIRMPGFQYVPFTQDGVAVAAGKTRRLDISLFVGNLGTIGDDPFTYLAEIRAGSKELAGPVPRTADGHPDLSGVWNGNDDLYPDDPALLPWAAEVLQKSLAKDLQDMPRGMCLPAGVLPLGPFFRKFVHVGNLLVVLNEDEVVGYRQIFLDGRAHPADLEPTWQGHSIGRWDGDTLVVDATGFNAKSVMSIFPHTEQLRVTERYHRRDYGHMDVQVIADDPGALTKPWTLNMVWDLTPDQDLHEYVCTESTLNMHLEWRKAAGY
jgi:Carboxypeptidase regulatory-like domain